MWSGQLDRTVRLLEGGMDLAVARRRVLAANVANAETPGYKAADLDFDRLLDQAGQSGPLARPAVLTRTHAQHRGGESPTEPSWPVRYVMEPMGEVRADGNTVDLEGEMMRLAQNQIRFQALTQAMNRVFSKLREAITEGGRR
jgi:flagellar basal-body rod protein FlgB